jgi:hypothetical protein
LRTRRVGSRRAESDQYERQAQEEGVALVAATLGFCIPGEPSLGRGGRRRNLAELGRCRSPLLLRPVVSALGRGVPAAKRRVGATLVERRPVRLPPELQLLQRPALAVLRDEDAFLSPVARGDRRHRGRVREVHAVVLNPLRAQRAEDLVVLGEPAAFLLGVDELPVANHVELARLADDRLGVDPVRVQLGRETRGPLVIARSGRAVVDLDRHEPHLTPR